MVSVTRKDIVDELKECIAAAKQLRPGTADGNVNPFAIPVQVHTGVLERAIAEIEQLRRKAGAVTDGESFTEIKRMAHAGGTLVFTNPDPYEIKYIDKPSDTE